MCNELTNKEKKAIKSIPIGANANNNQTVKFNSATGKFEFINFSSGGGDVSQATNNTFTGNNTFNGAVTFNDIARIGDYNIATTNDLTNFVTDTELGTALSSYVTSSALGTTLSDYVTNSELNTALGAKANTSSLANNLKLNQPIAGLTYSNITDYNGNATIMQINEAYFKLVSTYDGSFGHIVENKANTTNAISQIFFVNNTGASGQIFSGSETCTYGSNVFVVRQVKAAPMRFVSDGANSFYFGSSLNGVSPYATFDNSKIDLNKATKISSTLNVGGTFTNAARMHVRGDGTNPIARFESSTGAYYAGFSQFAFGTIFNLDGYFSITQNTGSIIYSSINNGTGAIGSLPIHDFTANTDNSTSLTSNLFRVKRTFAANAGSANFRPFTVEYTINNSGAQTGTATGIFINATETNLNGMVHRLFDLAVNGFSQVSYVANNGLIISSDHRINFNSRGSIYSPSDGIIQLSNSSKNDFNRLVFGTTGPTAPALKKNGAELQVKLADDTAMANFAANIITAYGKVNLASSSTTSASMNVKAGTAPTTPIDGDIWYDGTDMYIRVAGANKRFTTTG
jgi:hypothetical protein